MNNLEKFLEKINRGEVCLGAGVQFREPMISELFSEIGFDFLWICAEHTAADRGTVLSHIMATKGTDTAPFVRVPGNEPFILKPFLDMNPAGIIFPFISTPEDAIKAVKSCRYPPEGIRGYGPTRPTNYYMMDKEKYFEMSKYNPWVILQIEHIDAVKNLDKILEVPGIGSIVIGPNDLANSIGIMGGSRSLEVSRLIETILKKARDKKVTAGVSIGYDMDELDNYKKLVDLGASWFDVAFDMVSIRNYSQNVLDKIKKIFK
ncbi:MAG: aldolase/citrate lyase family protein [Actinomycetota bacterium]